MNPLPPKLHEPREREQRSRDEDAADVGERQPELGLADPLVALGQAIVHDVDAWD